MAQDPPSPYALTREAAIEALVGRLPANALTIATTGKPSRELFEVRERRGESHDADLLTVGSMGHASQIALGVALSRPERPVVCLDGDGAALMHMGGLATLAQRRPANLRHVVVNNGAHDSVGGQPTVAFEVDLCAVALACGYRRATQVTDAEGLAGGLEALFDGPGPTFLEIRVARGARKDLGRPTMTPADLKARFMASARPS